MQQEIFNFIAVFITYFYKIYTFLLFVRIIFSWLRPVPNRFTYFINDVTDPVLNLAKRIIPPIGMIDISPIFAFIALDFIYKVLMYGLIMLSTRLFV